MKLVLLGYMGCGKSAISNALSNSLNLKRIDLDDYIEEKEGKTIADIFTERGEIYFRKLETACLQELLDSNEEFILSLGGGTPCFGNNMEIINQKSTSVYLSANIPTLVIRLLPEKAKRPLIARIEDEELAEFIGKHLFERRHYYLQAKIAVSVDNKPVQIIADEIAMAL
ncbi:shikimate kinase [Wenyingzhuangia fucanilytica]|uniref:Shikimate kinase n=1 Tax=Wenyingzhuangia fucanilytica TaxID=1790137 RepID=A0A1B1Y3H6_9FLAO|nr:shikimate kinase [Wenyingzhuangia fucanilytica]ANW95310.1 shikimate kinase [Wenyingzhuangia fucanilytica]